jgi:acylphosphatase
MRVVEESVMAATRFVVSGKVQRVAFRAATREQAGRFGLSGYARNLADGRVEVLAVGEEGAISALERWLWQGPPAARVEEVTRETAEAEVTQGFHIG